MKRATELDNYQFTLIPSDPIDVNPDAKYVSIIEPVFTMQDVEYYYPCEITINRPENDLLPIDDYLDQIISQLADYYGWPKTELDKSDLMVKYQPSYVGNTKLPSYIAENCGYIPLVAYSSMMKDIIVAIAEHYHWKKVPKVNEI